MHKLDDKVLFFKTNKSFIYESISMVLDQIEDAFFEAKDVKIPESYKNAENIIIAGMGGSALGGRIIDSLLPERVRIPIEIYTEFRLPFYANKKSLVIVSSYSGDTDETLTCAKKAINLGADVIGITTGGKLEELLKKNNLPLIRIVPKKNPSDQPRTGVGYSIGSLVSILTSLGFIHIDDKEIIESASNVKKLIPDFAFENELHRNLAKKYADEISATMPVLFSSGHLLGSTHTIKNQINENAKTFCVHFDIPEANHHLMEGLRHPVSIKEKMTAIFFYSELYDPEIKKRYPITRDVIEKNGIRTMLYKCQTDDKLTQIFELLVFGAFLSFYLTMQNGEDPSIIPWVDYFKEKLS